MVVPLVVGRGRITVVMRPVGAVEVVAGALAVEAAVTVCLDVAHVELLHEWADSREHGAKVILFRVGPVWAEKRIDGPLDHGRHGARFVLNNEG